jgi:hypothetical protein
MHKTRVADAASEGHACDGLTEPEAAAGTYVLSTVGGEPVPHRVITGDDYRELTSSSMRLGADTTFFWTIAATTSFQGEVTVAEDTATGTYSLVEATIEFYFADADIVYHCLPVPGVTLRTMTGSIAGDTFTIVLFEGIPPWVFVKV